MSEISNAQYQKARNDESLYIQRIISYQTKFIEAEADLNKARDEGASTETISQIENRLARASESLDAAKTDLTNAQIVIAEFENQTTIPSVSDTEILKKYESATIQSNSRSQDESGVVEPDAFFQETDEYGRPVRVPYGAMPAVPKVATVTIKSISGNTVNQDTRVKIRVPDEYITNLTRGGKDGILRQHKGIIFPYTPQISFQNKADYASQNPLHSNYTQYFYQKSSVSDISISGKFSVANEDEAEIYISIIHLLRALTKMKSGGLIGDADSGTPPPVCRLDAYGAFMLQNVPVAISMFKIDLPDNVDYFTLGKRSGTSANSNYDATSVPVLSNITITCIPMYSRAEMQRFSVSKWLNDKGIRKAGFL